MHAKGGKISLDRRGGNIKIDTTSVKDSFSIKSKDIK